MCMKNVCNIDLSTPRRVVAHVSYFIGQNFVGLNFSRAKFLVGPNFSHLVKN